MERRRGGDSGRAVAGTFMDRRCAASALRSWWMTAAGRFPMEAERCCMVGPSAVGDRQSSSMTFGRPTWAYETMTAMSQLLPLSHRDMDMVLTLPSLMGSWMTASS
jgi:hypothetical protein